MKKVKLYFDPETHTYFDDENNFYTSSTTLIGKYEKEFKNKFWTCYRAIDQAGYRLRPEINADIIYVERSAGTWLPYTVEAITTGAHDLALNWTTEFINNRWRKLADEACLWGNDRHDYLESCVDSFYGGKDKLTIDELQALREERKRGIRSPSRLQIPYCRY